MYNLLFKGLFGIKGRLKNKKYKIAKEVDILEILGLPKGPVAIEGTYEDYKRDYVYFEDNTKKTFSKLFDELSDKLLISRDYKSDGSMMSLGTIIITPDNVLFHCASLSGDIENWRKGLDRAAKSLNLLVADITGIKYKELGDNAEDYVNLESYKKTGKAFDFVLSNGKKYKLSDCEIYMPSAEKMSIFETKIKELRKMIKERIKSGI